MPATNSLEHPAIRRRGVYALAAMALLSVGVAAPLRAQATDDLDFVDHITVDFAHNTVLNTNIALYYLDYTGDFKAPPAYIDDGEGHGNTAFFNLFSTKGVNTLSYGPDGAIGWKPQVLYGSAISTGGGLEVSYTPVTTVNDGPAVSDKYSTRNAAMTGSRNALYAYNLADQTRWGFTTLLTDPSGPPFTPAKALLATGFYTSLVVTNGGIYSVDTRNADQSDGTQVTPLVTPQDYPGKLSNPSAMSVGPDGLLYVLDYGLDDAGESTGVNRIEKFNLTTGEYLSQFFLPDDVTVFPTSLAISANGHIYLGDGLGGGSVFDLTGDLLGTFDPPTGTDWTVGDGGLIAGSPAGVGSFLEYDGLGNIFTYVEGQGIFMYHDPTFVVPEPSTWALLLGGLAVLSVLRRRTGRSQPEEIKPPGERFGRDG